MISQFAWWGVPTPPERTLEVKQGLNWANGGSDQVIKIQLHRFSTVTTALITDFYRYPIYSSNVSDTLRRGFQGITRLDRGVVGHDVASVGLDSIMPENVGVRKERTAYSYRNEPIGCQRICRDHDCSAFFAHPNMESFFLIRRIQNEQKSASVRFLYGDER